jgi:hypothetical protein
VPFAINRNLPVRGSVLPPCCCCCSAIRVTTTTIHSNQKVPASVLRASPLLLGLAGPSSNRPRAPHCNCAIAWTEYAIGAPALPGGACKGHLYHITLDGCPALSRRHRAIGQVWAQCDGQRNMWAETKKRKTQQGGKGPLVLYFTSGTASR